MESRDVGCPSMGIFSVRFVFLQVTSSSLSCFIPFMGIFMYSYVSGAVVRSSVRGKSSAIISSSTLSWELGQRPAYLRDI